MANAPSNAPRPVNLQTPLASWGITSASLFENRIGEVRDFIQEIPMQGFRNVPVCRMLSFGPFLLDTSHRRIEKDGVEWPIGECGMDILLTLISRPLEVVSTRELTAAVWPFQTLDPGCLHSHVDILLNALGDNAGTRYIADVAGHGFSFMAPVGIAEIGTSRCGPVLRDKAACMRLDESQQTLFGSLVGLGRPFSLPDAFVVTIGTGLDPLELPVILAQLVAKSLVVAPVDGLTSAYRLAGVVRPRVAEG